MAIAETIFEDAAASSLALAQAVASDLRAALEHRAAASLVVSGGKSPVPFFHALREAAIDWARVTVTLADERWVDPSSDDSNERLVRTHLLQGAAAAASFVPLKTPAATPAEGLAETTVKLTAVPRPFDVVVLGMGDDGHTASLFPETPGLEHLLDPAAEAIVAETKPHMAPYVPRITMTLRALLDARRIYLPIAGAAKRKVYEAVRAGAPAAQHPVAAILRQDRTPVEVWLA